MRQAEGGEQGDPLMLLLFSLAIHDSLVEADWVMDLSEHLLAFLDDAYVVSPPHRTRPMFDVLGEELETGAGIRLHPVKTQVWNREAICHRTWRISERRFGTRMGLTFSGHQ